MQLSYLFDMLPFGHSRSEGGSEWTSDALAHVNRFIQPNLLSAVLRKLLWKVTWQTPSEALGCEILEKKKNTPEPLEAKHPKTLNPPY